MTFKSFSIFTAAALLCLAGQAAPQYRIEPLPGVDGAAFNAVALNNRGLVAGYSESGTATRAFVYGQNGFTFLSQGGSFSLPVDINERGQVLFNAISAGGLTQPFIYDGGRSVNISPGPGQAGRGRALSSAGTAVGDFGTRVFYFDGKSSRTLDLGLQDVRAAFATGLNRDGVIVGRALTGGDASRAFVYRDGRASFIEGLVDAYAVSDGGGVLGQDGRGYVVRGADGRSTALDFTAAPHITRQGWVVGSALVDGEMHAFVRGRQGRSVDLNDALAAGDAARWTLSSAVDINERGHIVGMGVFDGVRSAFIATPVPEAPAWALSLYGLALLAGAARWRQARQRQA